MSPAIDRVATSRSTTTPSSVSVSQATRAAQKGESFTVSAADAQKLVKAIPPDLMGLSTAQIEKTDKGWVNGNGEVLVEVRFPKAVKHDDGPFVRAFLDPTNDQVFFMHADMAKELDSASPPPPDLMSDPEIIQADVLGSAQLGSLRRSLQLQPLPAKGAAPAKPGGTKQPVDRFSPAKAGGKELSQTQLARKTREYLLANMGDDKLLPAIDGGNLGSAAVMLADKPAANLLSMMKDTLRGVPAVQAFKFEPARHQLFAVVDSEDEIHLHVGVIDRKSGEITYLRDVNTVDLPEIKGAQDSTIAHLDRVTKGGKWLALGPGEAPPSYWQG